MMTTPTIVISTLCVIFAGVLFELEIISVAVVFTGMFFLILTDAIVTAIEGKK